MKLQLVQMKILLSRLKQQKCKTALETEYWCDAVTAVKEMIRKYELLISMREKENGQKPIEQQS